MDYVEKKFLAHRKYALGEHSLVISGKNIFGTTFRMELALEKIKPAPDVVSIKDDTRTAYVGTPGFAVFVIGLLCSNILYPFSPVLYWIVLAGGISAMLFGFVFGGRIKAYLFKNQTETTIFDITERGNSPSRFEEFVAALSAKILSAQTSRPS